MIRSRKWIGIFVLALLSPLLFAPLPALAQQMVPATLAGHAVLPALSFSAPPADAPTETWISGRYTAGPAPVRVPQSLAGNGTMRPFFGQPLDIGCRNGIPIGLDIAAGVVRM